MDVKKKMQISVFVTGFQENPLLEEITEAIAEQFSQYEPIVDCPDCFTKVTVNPSNPDDVIPQTDIKAIQELAMDCVKRYYGCF